MSNLKVEGKVGDFCLNCKNCKAVTRVHDGETASIRIIEVDCEDPYDGMTKTLDVDSDICCSMFEPKPDHGRYPWGKDKNENESMYSELIKASKRKDELIQDYREKLKKANKLADSWKRDYERIREQFLCPICNILYPDNPNLDINVTDLLNDVKNLKIYAGENKSMYEDLKYWKERCHRAETDVTTLNSKVEILKARDYKQCSRIMELEFAVNKLQSGEYDDILAKDIEIKSLQAKYEDAMSGWKHTIESYDMSHQTISDQEVTIKALLLTIKEMCKEENGNA